MFEVVYFSTTGNTRKVAEVMAGTLGVTARDVKDVGIISPEAFVFLGMGCYRGELPGEVKDFLRVNRFEGRKIALFTTSAFNAVDEQRDLEKQLAANGAVIVRRFKCLGRLLSINQDHPTWLELKKAAWFARSAALTLFTPQLETAEFVSLVS
jgi:flavodoxin